MGARFVDFDRMLSEMKRETITFRVFGEDFAFPASVPTLVVLELMALDERQGVPPDVLMRVAGAIFGEQALQKWTARSEFTLEMLSELLKTALNLIAGEVPEGSVTEDDAAHPKN